jgi:hypothetical protein
LKSGQFGPFFRKNSFLCVEIIFFRSKKIRKKIHPQEKDIRGVLLVMVNPIPIMLGKVPGKPVRGKLGDTPNRMHNEKTI